MFALLQLVPYNHFLRNWALLAKRPKVSVYTHDLKTKRTFKLTLCSISFLDLILALLAVLILSVKFTLIRPEVVSVTYWKENKVMKSCKQSRITAFTVNTYGASDLAL